MNGPDPDPGEKKTWIQIDSGSGLVVVKYNVINSYGSGSTLWKTSWTLIRMEDADPGPGVKNHRKFAKERAENFTLKIENTD